VTTVCDLLDGAALSLSFLLKQTTRAHHQVPLVLLPRDHFPGRSRRRISEPTALGRFLAGFNLLPTYQA
jgi:hypothetical protein